MEYFISYAQNGEDILLFRALKHLAHGFYIDVGAQDPVEDSVTKAFYERGWRGINIEPVQHWHDRLVTDRPHDVNLKVAAADHSGELELFEVSDSGLSTSDPEFARQHAETGLSVRETRVKCLTLDEICSRHAVETVHFLKIDCEGAERQVLQGISLESVRPWIVVVEATEPNSSKPTWQDWEHLLTDRAYIYVYTDGLSRFYVAREHSELRNAFHAPPNPLDWAVRATEVRAHEEAKRLSVELAQLRSTERTARAETERDYLRNECERREQELARLRHELQTRDAKVSEALSELDMLRGKMAEQRAESERLQRAESERQRAVVDELQARLLDAENRYAESARSARELGQRVAELMASRSWRITAPLRTSGNAFRAIAWTSRTLAYKLVRPIARSARPGMRRMASWRPARRLVVGAFGRNSRLIHTARLFLFGAPPLGARSEVSDIRTHDPGHTVDLFPAFDFSRRGALVHKIMLGVMQEQAEREHANRS